MKVDHHRTERFWILQAEANDARERFGQDESCGESSLKSRTGAPFLSSWIRSVIDRVLPMRATLRICMAENFLLHDRCRSLFMNGEPENPKYLRHCVIPFSKIHHRVGNERTKLHSASFDCFRFLFLLSRKKNTE